MEHTELAADQRFARGPERLKHRRAMDQILEEVLARRPVGEWVETLNAAGVACGPIYTLDQVFADPQVAEFGLVHEQEHRLWGLVKVLGLPVRLSRTPAEVRTAAPLPGQHTREVLEGLGYDEPTIERLLDERVIEVAKGERP
jgi:formyl-CoA transferase